MRCKRERDVLEKERIVKTSIRGKEDRRELIGTVIDQKPSNILLLISHSTSQLIALGRQNATPLLLLGSQSIQGSITVCRFGRE